MIAADSIDSLREQKLFTALMAIYLLFIINKHQETLALVPRVSPE